MINLERTEVMNLHNAIRGARNPMNSWDRSDSSFEDGRFVLGPNDLDLAGPPLPQRQRPPQVYPADFCFSGHHCPPLLVERV